jgi:hypothetical protein
MIASFFASCEAVPFQGNGFFRKLFKLGLNLAMKLRVTTLVERLRGSARNETRMG